MSLTILQFGYGVASEMLSTSKPVYEKLANKYNCAHIQSSLISKEIREGTRTPHWGKTHNIKYWLKDSNASDIVLWADADTLPIRYDHNPKEVLREDYDIGLVLTKYGWWQFGIAFLRGTPLTKELIKNIDFFGPMGTTPETRWNDELRLNDLLPAYVNAGLKIQVIDSAWNESRHNAVISSTPTIIKAWHGDADDFTIRRMKEEITKWHLL